MKKRKIILLIIIVAVAACAVVFVLLNLNNVDTGTGQNNQPQTTEDIKESLEENLSVDVGENDQIVIIGDDQTDYIDANTQPDIFDENEDSTGKQVMVKGTVYNEPVYKENLWSFIVQTPEGKYASIVAYDENEQIKMKKGDNILIKGVLTAYTSIEDDNKQIIKLPMINAQSVENQ